MDSFEVRSVVDVGCGTGAWLAVARDLGASTVLGLDGSYVDAEQLVIAPHEFEVADLARGLNVADSFDLVMSLEVAEHLPAARAESFVDDLCRLGDLVLFSAAVPGQGGRAHVNERRQSYWVGLFESRGFLTFDVIRPRIWNDASVEPWYRQNALLFVRSTRADLVERADRLSVGLAAPLDIVHPETLVVARTPIQLGLRSSLTSSWVAALRIARTYLRSVSRRLRRARTNDLDAPTRRDER